jgi:hypothetical protein
VTKRAKTQKLVNPINISKVAIPADKEDLVKDNTSTKTDIYLKKNLYSM